MPLISETERLYIKSWTMEDVPHFLTLSKDVGYTCFSPPGIFLVRDEKDAAQRVAQRKELFERCGLGKFLLFTKSSHEFVGTCGIDPYKLDDREEFELGYRLCLKFWQQGFATEAAKAILDYGFTTLGLERIIAFALHQNAQSLKVIEKLGFRYERDITHADLSHKLYGYAAKNWRLQNHQVNFPEIKEAVSLRRSNQAESALNLIKPLLQKHPHDPELNYQLAVTCDSMGLERDAIPYYEKALAQGLSSEKRLSALLGLGSSLRCLGEYERALAIFDGAISEFSNERALKVFRALTLFNLGCTEEAFSALLIVLIDSTSDRSIRTYESALRFYSDKLNQIW